MEQTNNTHKLTFTGKTKYESVEQLKTAIEDAFKTHKIYTKHMLYNAIGIDRHTLADWKKGSTIYKDMSNIILTAFDYIEDIIVVGSVEGKFNGNFTKFLLNSQFQWKENAPVNNAPVNVILSNSTGLSFDKPITQPKESEE